MCADFFCGRLSRAGRQLNVQGYSFLFLADAYCSQGSGGHVIVFLFNSAVRVYWISFFKLFLFNGCCAVSNR
jgi:hypothetical protein